jgi:hypothetical protein
MQVTRRLSHNHCVRYVIASCRSIPTPSDVPVNCCQTTLSARCRAYSSSCCRPVAFHLHCNHFLQPNHASDATLVLRVRGEYTFTTGFSLVIFCRYDSICRLRSDPLPSNKTLLQEVIVIAIFAPARLLIEVRCFQSKSPALVSRWLPDTLCRTTISITSSSC